MTNVWLTIATRFDAPVSLPLKPLPESSGMPIVWKYPGLTHANFESPFAAPTVTPCVQLDPDSGTFVVEPALRTPGTERTSSIRSRWNASRRSFGISCGMPTKATEISKVIRLRKLRTNSRAPTSRTSETAICATTMMRCMENRSRPAVNPRPAPRITDSGCMRVTRSAGSAPKTTQVSAAAEAANNSTRQSSSSGRWIELLSVDNEATSMRLTTCATPTPIPAPIAASNVLSAVNCRSSLPREAPSASRTAISRSRALDRASMRLARFAHAMSRTSPVIPNSSQSDES